MELSKNARALTLVLAVAASGSAWAGGGRYGGHHHHNHWGPAAWGLAVGVPLAIALSYSAPPVYYSAPPVVVPPRVVYVEREVPPPPARQQHYWYYCANPQGYYPYVQQCSVGWQQVLPTPPS